MARPRNQPSAADDDEEASASSFVPPPSDPVLPTNLTPFERETLERQTEERRKSAETEGRRKEHERRMEADLRKAQNVLADKVRAVLREHFQGDPTAEDIVTGMMHRIKPVLDAGKEGGRRERLRTAPAVPKPAS